jgi:hypothetical protein
MSSHSNEYTFAKEFVGDLHVESQRVPVELTTRLRVMTKPHSDEIRRYSSQVFDRAPQYVFGGGSLPLHPRMQAVGRHFFTW